MGNKRSTLYIGVTNDLVRRVSEHKNHMVKGFTSDYLLDRLLYYESYEEVKEALVREKQLKHWKREWKLKLIETENPTWKDLYKELV